MMKEQHRAPSGTSVSSAAASPSHTEISAANTAAAASTVTTTNTATVATTNTAAAVTTAASKTPQHIAHVNAMPAFTWGRLNMNETSLEIPAEFHPASENVITLSVTGDARIIGDDTAQDAFEHALDKAAEHYAHLRRSSAQESTAQHTQQGDADKHNSTGQSLDIPALSAYQKDACALEEAYEPARAFKTGMGQDALNTMRSLASSNKTVEVSCGGTGTLSVHVEGLAHKLAISAVDVIVGDGASLDITVELDGSIKADTTDKGTPDGGIADKDSLGEYGTVKGEADKESTFQSEGSTAHSEELTSPSEGSTAPLISHQLHPTEKNTFQEKESPSTELCGIVGSSLRVFAGVGSRVSIVSYQTADDELSALDDTGLTLADDARVCVRHVVLGAQASMTGLAADIPGQAAKLTVDTSYLGTNTQTRDFNYEICHRGRQTESEMTANGVLANTSSKCLRGTIDLVHGCKGSQGTEHETVLLADKNVRNKTIPVILCDEDDVMGNHGATIGHVRPDQLFYLQSRGISPEEAEALFCRAKLEDAAVNAPSGQARAAVERLASHITDIPLDITGFSHEEVLA